MLPLLVLKIGTSSITKSNGTLDEPVIISIAQQIAQLHQYYRIVIVSSGAVGTGRKFLPNYSGNIIERKAAAAIGNPILLNKYSTFFAPYGMAIAQSLCERQHFSNRTQFLQLKATFEELWKNNIIPIANENDVVSNLELKFSDNDELATLIAVGFGASVLLLGTSVAGVLDENDQIIPQINTFDHKTMGLARQEKSTLGLGGMISKLTFARLATRMGIKVVIFGTQTSNGILQAVEGKTGTICTPQTCTNSARQKWLASGSLVTGRIQVDAGAYQALQNRRSLLAVGILQIAGSFEKGEVVEVTDSNNLVFAVARTKLSSQQIEASLKQQNLNIAHADDIVLL